MMSIGWVIARWRRARPRSLLDNKPLEALLEQAGQHRAAAPGDARRPPARRSRSPRRATARACTSPSTTRSTTSCRGRARSASRCAPRSRMPHLLASSAIPFVFPAVALDIDGRAEYCGDGSMRQAAPISPAVHLGAERILVVGAGRMHEPPGERAPSSDYPNLAQIAGHALSNIFLDALAVDVERLQRINARWRCCRRGRAPTTSLKPIEVLVIAPSERLDDIAAKHLGEPAAADPRAAARHRRLRPGRRRARRGAGELPAVRGAVHARADRARRARHDGAARRGARLLRLGAEAARRRRRAGRGAAPRQAARRCRPRRRGRVAGATSSPARRRHRAFFFVPAAAARLGGARRGRAGERGAVDGQAVLRELAGARLADALDARRSGRSSP